MDALNTLIFVPNYPPPPLIKPAQHYEEARVDLYRQRLKSFIENRSSNASQLKNRERIRLRDASSELNECMAIIDELKTIFDSDLNTEKMIDWKKKESRMLELTDKYSSTEKQEQIKLALHQRTSKRQKIKLRKQQSRQWRKEIENKRRKKLEMTDKTIQANQQRIAEEKLRVEADNRAEEILVSVKHRQADALKNIEMFHSIIELHRIRRIKEGKNENFESEIVDEVSNMIEQWKSFLEIYRKEEMDIRRFLNKNDVLVEWKEVLFECGFSDNLNSNKKRSIDDLIRIRQKWDDFITSGESSFAVGSTIPVGWVTPSKQPTIEWSKYATKMGELKN